MSMECEFALTPDDDVALERLLSRRLLRDNWWRRWAFFQQFMVWCCGMLALLSYWHHFSATSPPRYKLLGVALLLIVLTRLVSWLLGRYWRGRYLRSAPDGAFQRRRQLRVSAAGLEFRDAHGFSQVDWGALRGWERDPRNYYLMVDTLSAIVIPRAAVADFQAEFERLLQVAAPVSP